MTKEEWEYAEKRLYNTYSRLQLKVDDYDVSIVVEPLKPLKNVLVVYVNGEWKGKWLSEDCEERRRFYQKHTGNILSRKEQKRLAREKKAVRETVGKTTYDWYSPYWTSFRSLKSHLLKNNKSIEFVKLS